MSSRRPPPARSTDPARRSPWRITLTYIAIGCAWIVLSDIGSLLLGSRAEEPILTISMVKGIFWIVASGLLLHLLVFERVARARVFEAAVRRRLLEGEEVGRFGIAESFAGDVRARWSDGMFRLWGRSPAEGEPDAAWLANHIDPADLERARVAADAAARGESPPPYEIRIHAADGATRDLRITTRTETAFGRVRTLVLAQDVSELRALERNAAESLGLLRSMLESTAEGIVVVRVDTRELLLWNERFLEMCRIPVATAARLDAREVLATFVAQVRNEEQVRAWTEEVYRNLDAECVDLVELKDGTVLERFTAPVRLEGEPRARIWSYRDVTDRIRAHEALARREQALRESQQIARLGSFEWDIGTDEAVFSDALCRLFGLPPSDEPKRIGELLGMVARNDIPMFETAMAAARRGEEIRDLTYRVVRTDGVVRLMEARGRLSPHGRKYLGTIRDVTEEHAARRALAEAEERFRATFEQAAVGIAHLTTEGLIVRANETLCAAIGCDRHEIVGTPAVSLLEPADADRASREMRRVVEGSASSSQWELRYRTHDGEVRWASVTLSAARLDEGPSYVIAVAQDVTERRRADEERERLARQVNLLLTSTDAGLFTVDLEGRCTLVNRAATEMLGYGEEDLAGRRLTDILHGDSLPPSETTTAIARANAGVSSRIYNHRFVRADGSTLPADVTVSPIFEDYAVIGRAVSFLDVSERMRLEEQLENAKRLSSLGRLAASIAHEINNVLMGILPFAEIVARSKETVFHNAGEQIRQSVQRGRGVTQEILRFAREEPPQRQVFEGRSWIRSVAGELQEIVGSRTLTMRIPETPFHFDADPTQLAQVLINLVVNARDATDAGRGRIEIAFDVAEPRTAYSFGVLPDRGHRWISIRVSDNGAGMDADTLKHLFEPFFTKKRGGTGLGLAIAYRIVAAHDGLLFVESEEGNGSSFHLLLPEAKAPADQAPVESVVEQELTGDALLVEDDETVAAGLAHVLEEAGMRTRTARTGAEALAALDQGRPTVLILDVGLPDIHGDVVCERALARWPDLPIVFSTGHADATRLSIWLKRPNVRFLMKPYTSQQLRAAIAAATGRPERDDPPG